jgi:hypothetical protein
VTTGAGAVLPVVRPELANHNEGPKTLASSKRHDSRIFR